MFRRRIEVRLVKEKDIVEVEPGTKVIFAVHAVTSLKMAGEVALKLYATKKAIDFAAQAAEHIVSSKIR